MQIRRLVAALTLATTASLTVIALPTQAAVAKPTVTGVSSNYGSIRGGNTVTVTGTNLTGATAVKFGPNPGTRVTVASKTKLTVVVPAHAAATLDVRVTTPGGTSAIVAADHYRYYGAPVVTAVNGNHGPTQGGGDALLTVTGYAGPTSVKVDGVAIGHIDFFDLTDGTVEVDAQMPAHAEGRVNITVTAVGGTSAPVVYTYADKPVIRLTPASGPAGVDTGVQLRGTGLYSVSSIKIDGVEVPGPIFYSLGSDPYIGFTLPAHARGTSRITLTALGGTSDPVVYTYTG